MSSPELEQLRSRLSVLESLGNDPDIEEARIKIEARILALITDLTSQQAARPALLEMLSCFKEENYWLTLSIEEKCVIYKTLVKKIIVKDGQVHQIVLNV